MGKNKSVSPKHRSDYVIGGGGEETSLNVPGYSTPDRLHHVHLVQNNYVTETMIQLIGV